MKKRISVLMLLSRKYVLALSFVIFVLAPNLTWAKRTISGTIKYADGRFASGLLVKAYDSDDGKDDFMGQATTNSKGWYKMRPYKAKHWDPAPHNITTWRPDIYVIVYAKVKNKWVQVKKSKTYKNRKHKYDTKFDLIVPGIGGVIKDKRNKPVSGIKVRAWDEDGMLGGKHDFLNETTTDSQGRYFMVYEGKHWDPSPHNVTKWRPDIFIKVLRNVGRYGWVRVHRSETYSDWKHAKTLTINASMPENKWSGWKRTAFERDKHGWPFLNDPRNICIFPTCRDEHPMGKFGKATRFKWALCGGMSLSALNRFRNGQPVTDFSPKIKKELVTAQIRTLLPFPYNWTRFVKWTMKPDQPHTVALHTIGHSTKEEWPKLKKAIDRRAPIIMGIIFAGPSNVADDVASNHQVLATGYRYNNGTKEVEIEVYDPNYFETCTIAMNIGIPRNQLRAQEYTPDDILKFRGFFVIDEGSGPLKPSISVVPTQKQQPMQGASDSGQQRGSSERQTKIPRGKPSRQDGLGVFNDRGKPSRQDGLGIFNDRGKPSQ